MPVFTQSRAPLAPGDPALTEHLNTEPIYVSTYYWKPGRHHRQGGIYLTFWYIGEIEEDAVSLPSQSSLGRDSEQHDLGTPDRNWHARRAILYSRTNDV